MFAREEEKRLTVWCGDPVVDEGLVLTSSEANLTVRRGECKERRGGGRFAPFAVVHDDDDSGLERQRWDECADAKLEMHSTSIAAR